MEDIIKKEFPQNYVVDEALNENIEKIKKSVWVTDSPIGSTNFSAFLLPRPILNLWYTSVIKWDSYENTKSIVADLKNFDIEYIADVKDKKLIFLPLESYAKKAVKYERNPKKTFYDYGFPKELTALK